MSQLEKLNDLERLISLFHCFMGSFDECEQLMSVLRSIEIAIQFRIYIEKKLIRTILYFIWNWDEILKTDAVVVNTRPLGALYFTPLTSQYVGLFLSFFFNGIYIVKFIPKISNIISTMTSANVS